MATGEARAGQAPPLQGGGDAGRSHGALVVCPTPIGNLEDVTLRVLRELGEADLVLCEDTRRTRGLLERHGVRARLASFHRHNEAARTAEILPRLEAGERIAVASDAGLPGVNDPGARLVAAAIERGVAVTVLPGPSAVETALVASGLIGDRYCFVGYLPRAREALGRLWGELPAGGPTVAFESPRRLPAALASLAAHDPARRVAVCRELTKRFEEVVRGSAAELAARFAEPPKGEVTLVIAPPPPAAPDEEAAVAAVAELVGSGVPRRKAAEIVAGLTGVARNRLYRGSLEPAERAGESRRSLRDS
jgi:16S rRNA (cytidine1402-2'-O)-methyltransferase